MKYEVVLAVVRHAESALTGSRLDHTDRWLQSAIETVLDGPGLVIAGGQILLWRIFWVLFTTAVFVTVLRVLDSQDVASVFLPSFFLAMGVVYFSTPSRSMAAGVNPKRVADVRQFILSIADQPQQLQSLSECIEVVRTHTMQKLARFNVLAGIAWGVLFWFVGTHALAPGLPAEAVSRGLSHSMVGVLVFALVLCAGICHATAVRAVCQILDFAMIEAKAEMASTQGAPQKN
ncbi:hypothetical protein LJR143_001605 [Pseudoxanthomonas sp. LjRoot143]|uniref:hypothetical protein n=1 Tax=Pseudoxanthomonas sp. LjRoot143 TaxID=3342266 RepID=UPI000DB60CF9|nr:MAG: hypothetical protein DI562_00200 [Stenotrophomonas acidaminiphila]